MTRYFNAAGTFGSVLTSIDAGFTWLTWCIPQYFNVAFSAASGTQIWDPYTATTRFNGITTNTTCTIAVGRGPYNNSFGVAQEYPAILWSNTGNVYVWIDPRIPGLPINSALSSVSSINGHFVAVGGSPTLQVIYSANGTTWTSGTVPSPPTVLATVSVAFYGGRNYAAAVSVTSGKAVIVGSTDAYVPFAYTSTDNGATWTARTMAPATNATFLAISANSTQFVAVGTQPFTGAPIISTSPDGITWTARTPSHGAGVLRSVFATDALIIAVGSNAAGTVPIAESSTDGITWTAIDPSFSSTFFTGYGGGQFNAVFHDSTLGWVAGGNYVPFDLIGSSHDIAMVGTWDGATWTEQRSPWVHAINAIGSLQMTIPSSALTIYCWDDSCHLFTSQDLGVSWYMSMPNAETEMGFPYPMMAMALADADYLSMATPAQGYTNVTIPGQPLGINDAVIAFVPDKGGANGTWNMLQYSSEAETGFILPGGMAISEHGTVQCVGGAFWNNANFDSPHELLTNIWITRNAGVTWNTTGSELGFRNWLAFAFGSTASGIMYGVSDNNNFVSKSTDFGVTWADLTGSPPFPTSGNELGDNGVQIRCSADGQTIIYAFLTATPNTTDAGQVWVSLNGGTTWTKKFTFGITSHNIDYIDAGISMNGATMMALESIGPSNGADGVSCSFKIHFSTDFGATWGTYNAFQNLSTTHHYLQSCNVSPDGTALVAYTGDYDMLLSTNSGGTWNRITTISPTVFDIPNTAFITPNTQPVPANPSPPPPPPPPVTVIYIERLQERILLNGLD